VVLDELVVLGAPPKRAGRSSSRRGITSGSRNVIPRRELL
jgi:hypothetical protein